MREDRQLFWSLLLAACDATAIILAWFLTWFVRDQIVAWWPFDLFPGEVPVLKPVDPALAQIVLAFTVPAWLAVFHALGRYRNVLHKQTIRAHAQAQGFALLTSLALLYLAGLAPISRTLLLAHALVSLALLALSERALHAIASTHAGSGERFLCLAPAGSTFLAQGTQDPSSPPCQALPDDLTLQSLGQMVRRDPIDGIRLRGLAPNDPRTLAVIACCAALGLSLDLDVSDWPSSPKAVEVSAQKLLLRFEPSSTALGFKRLLDIIGALLGLALLGPFALVAALCIRLTDHASPFYAQSRVGHHGRPFTMLKLRTMRPDADLERDVMRAKSGVGAPAFKLTDDPRVTKLGHFLRRWSIDEIPQLWHVLRGEMSLVGPRPPIPDEVARYQPHELRRLSMKPGLTCLWQVSGRSELDWPTWMALDLAYIDHWSLGLDLWLLLRTIPAVLSGRGAW